MEQAKVEDKSSLYVTMRQVGGRRAIVWYDVEGYLGHAYSQWYC